MTNQIDAFITALFSIIVVLAIINISIYFWREKHAHGNGDNIGNSGNIRSDGNISKS